MTRRHLTLLFVVALAVVWPVLSDFSTTVFSYIALYSLFWNFSDAYFDIQDAKRLFPLFSAFCALGTTIGAQIETDERDAARARAAVSSALAEARRSGLDLPRAIEAAGRTAPPSVAAKVDKALAIPIDLVEVAGWAVDRAAPDARFHLAIVCDGRIAAMAIPTRLRPDVAAGLSRPDLRRRRIGFSLIVPASACPKGAPLSPVFVDGAYRLLAAPPVAPAILAE